MAKEQGVKMREELEESKKEIRGFRESESRWKEERSKLRETQEELKRRKGKVELKESKERGEREGIGEGKQRIKELKKKMEMKDIEERTRDVIIRGMIVNEGNRKEAVEEVFREIGAKVIVI